MPYKRVGKCVQKEDGSPVKCHESVAKAEAHMRALMANVGDAKAGTIPVQAEIKAHSDGAAGVTFLLDFGSNQGIYAVQVLARHFMGDHPEAIIRWIEPRQFHITLVSTSLLDDQQLRDVMAKLPSEIGIIPVELGPIDVFEQDDKTVLILRAQSNDMLTSIQRSVYDAVVSTGAPVSEFSVPDDWQPHVTLAYAQPGIEAPEFAHTITASPRALLATRTDYYVSAGVPVAMPMMAEHSEHEDMRASKPAPSASLIKAIIQRLTRAQPYLMDDSGFKVEGNRWFAWYTNNWVDLETEAFPIKAIDYFIQRVKSGELPYPALWFSHLKSLPHGQADHLIRVGQMVLAAGTFDDSVLAHRMKTYYRAAQKRGVRFRVSHGFKYATRFKIRGAYYLFETYEISPIPEVGSFRAANPYTLWEVKTMFIPDELRREIAAALSEDGKTINDTTLKRADTIIADAKAEQDKAAAEGRQTKAAVTPEDVNARVDALEKKIDDGFASFAKSFDDKMGKALTAFETGVKTNVESANLFAAMDTRLKALEDWQKQQAQYAPPASHSIHTQLPADSAIALQLAGLETKHNQSAPPSLVEMLTGQKSADIDAQAAALNGGSSHAATA